MADVAFKLYLCDDEFHRYVRTKEGAQMIANEATVVKYTPAKELHYELSEYYLFGRRHRNSIVGGLGAQSLHDKHGDLPAYECEQWREWIYDGKRHREGDKPALIIGFADDPNNEQKWFKYGILYKYTSRSPGGYLYQKNLVYCVNDSGLAYLHQ
jgi:hypothetical protein